MRPGRCDLQAIAPGDRGQITAKLDDLLARAGDVRTNFRAEFDDGLVHLRSDSLLQKYFAVGQNLLDVRTQFARLWIDDLEFLLDPECKNVISRTHSQNDFSEISPKNIQLVHGWIATFSTPSRREPKRS